MNPWAVERLGVRFVYLPLRFTFGGLTDAGFRMLSLLESDRSAGWSWEDEVDGPDIV